MVSSFFGAVGNLIWPKYDENQVVVYALRTDHNAELVGKELQSFLGREKQVTVKPLEATYLLEQETVHKAKFHIVVVPGGWGRITSFAELVTHLYKQRVFFVRGVDSPTTNIQEREQENLRALIEDPHVAPLVAKGYKFIGGVAAFEKSKFREDQYDRLREFFGLHKPQAEVTEPDAKRQKVDEVKSKPESETSSHSSISDSLPTAAPASKESKMVSSFFGAVGNLISPKYDENQVVVYALRTDHNAELVRNELQSFLGSEKQVTVKPLENTFSLKKETVDKAKYHIVVVPGGWGRISSFAAHVNHLYKQRVFFVRGVDGPAPSAIRQEREQENFNALVEDPDVAPLVAKYKFIGGVATFYQGFREDQYNRLREFFELPKPPIEVTGPDAKRQKVEEVKSKRESETISDSSISNSLPTAAPASAGSHGKRKR